MPLQYRDPNTNQIVSSPKTLKVKDEVSKLSQSLEDAKLLQEQAIKGIDQNAASEEETGMAILELFEGRESDKLEVEEAKERALTAENNLKLAEEKIDKLVADHAALVEAQDGMMQAILEIYETGAGGSE